MQRPFFGRARYDARAKQPVNGVVTLSTTVELTLKQSIVLVDNARRTRHVEPLSVNVAFPEQRKDMTFIKTTTNPKHGTYTPKGPGLAKAKTVGGSTKISSPNPPAKVGTRGKK